MNIKDLILDRLETTLSEFSDDSGVNRCTIYNILHDKNKPSRPVIVKICKYFGVDYRDYL